LKQFWHSTLNRDSVLKRLERRGRINLKCSNEIEAIALYFREIDVAGLDKFDQQVVGRILSLKGLKVKSEDWLYEVIWRFVEHDRANFTLIQFVRFEFVSSDTAH
jgi:hypothetical protein